VSTARLMLLAGHGTTSAMIGLSTLLLIVRPGAAKQVRESDDPAFIRNAVEEMLRYLGTLHSGRRRVAIERYSWDDIGRRLVEIYEQLAVGATTQKAAA